MTMYILYYRKKEKDLHVFKSELDLSNNGDTHDYNIII